MMDDTTTHIQNCRYEVPFNLDEENVACERILRVFGDRLALYRQGEEEPYHTVSLDAIGGFSADKQVGAANFNIELNGKKTLLCRTTISRFGHFAELAKAMNYYLKTHDWTQLEHDETVCPRCKQPLFGNKNCPYCSKKGALLARFFKMFRHFYPLMALTLLTTLISQAFWIILPLLQRILIDDYIQPQSSNWSTYILVVLSMIVVHVIMTLTYRINARFTNQVSNGIGKELRAKVFAKVQSLSLSSISKKTSGELINRITSDTTRIQDFVADFGPELVLRIASFLAILIILLVTNFQLALIVLIPIPIVFFFVSKIQEKIHTYYLNFWRKGAKANSILHDILSGIRVVKCFGAEKREVEKYRDISAHYTAAQQRAELYWSYRFPFVDFLITVGQYFLLYFGSTLILQKQMTIGELTQLASYVAMIYVPIRWMLYIRRNISNVGVSAAKIVELLDEPDQQTRLDNTAMTELRGDVEFKHVFFSYKKYEGVLKDINFKVNAGEMVGIVGHSGVGKSTLINLILRLYDATEGEILIDGVDINALSQTSLRRQIGVVLQENFLFYDSIYENIRYSKPDATFEEVMRAAKIANAHSFIVKLPDGYNTRVGERGYSLSGGERQRIAIARAILHNPRVLILDEATASLDTKTETEIQEALDRLIAGRTTFAIAHRLSTLRQCDRLIVLDKGTVAESGTHSELMHNQAVYYNLVMAQRQTARIKQ